MFVYTAKVYLKKAKKTKIRDKTDSYVLNQISQADIRPPAKRGAAKKRTENGLSGAFGFG